MKENCYLKPSYSSSIRTDLPLTVIGKLTRKSRRELAEKIDAGQLLCVGKVYLKTHSGLIRIK